MSFNPFLPYSPDRADQQTQSTSGPLSWQSSLCYMKRPFLSMAKNCPVGPTATGSLASRRQCSASAVEGRPCARRHSRLTVTASPSRSTETGPGCPRGGRRDCRSECRRFAGRAGLRETAGPCSGPEILQRPRRRVRVGTSLARFRLLPLPPHQRQRSQRQQ